MNINLEKLEKEWNEYEKEFSNEEYMDIEDHTNMAFKVPELLNELKDKEALEQKWEVLKIELESRLEFEERINGEENINLIHDIQSLISKLETGEYFR